MAPLTAALATPAAAALLLLVLLAAPASAANFTCAVASGTTCNSAILYTSPNATTYGDLVARFNTTTLPDLLGANGLPDGTLSSAPVAANSTVKIPFRCRCNGDVGQSDRLPIYVVQPQDGLDAIARNVFNAFVTYQEIAAANNIPDPNKINVSQTLWIPLPCSCDKEEGSNVMHLAYSVGKGENTSAIAAKYGVTESTLLTRNKIDDPTKLQMGQILDVPLPVCRSSISDTSADHNLMLLPDGTYGFTAGNCIRCSCSSTTYQLNCTAVQNKGCPSVPLCNGTLKLGETNGTGCGSTTCAYSGYSNSSSLIIQTSLATNQTTACQKGGSGRSQFARSMWSMSVISFHMVLIIICFL
uniref:LysM domain-containing protein n=1 Tax=Oryza nivara TaxID=4536 RepID=A0A0E0GGD2_ORYNI